MKQNRYLIPLGSLLAVLALGALVMMVRASADDMLYQAAEYLLFHIGGCGFELRLLSSQHQNIRSHVEGRTIGNPVLILDEMQV